MNQRKILVAEDDEISQRLMVRLLEPFGRVECASDGKEAIEALARAYEEQSPYALVCLDVMMPHFTGLEVLKALRQMEHQRGIDEADAACAVMVTALEDKDSFLMSVAEGSQWYITKPVERASLYDVLDELGFTPGPSNTNSSKS